MYCSKCGADIGDDTICSSCEASDKGKDQENLVKEEKDTSTEKQVSETDIAKEEKEASEEKQESEINLDKEEKEASEEKQESEINLDKEEKEADEEKQESEIKLDKEEKEADEEKQESEIKLAKEEKETNEEKQESEIKLDKEEKEADEEKQESEIKLDKEEKEADEEKQESEIKLDKEEKEANEEKKESEIKLDKEKKEANIEKQEHENATDSVSAEVAATEIVNEEGKQEEASKTKKPISKSMLIFGISASVVIILLMTIIYIKGAPLREVKKYVLEDELFVGATEYKIDKRMLKSLKNAEKMEVDDGFFQGEQLSADITLKTDEFKAEGTVYIYKLGKEVIDDRYDLEYTPLKGVNKDNINQDLLHQKIELDDIGRISLDESNVLNLEVKQVKDNLKERKSSVVVALELSEDIYKALGNLEIEYVYKNGAWYIDTITPKEFEFSYLPGKDLEFSIDEFVDYYNRGRYFVQLAEGKKLSVSLEKNGLSLEKIEKEGIYSKIVTLNIDKKAPFYDVTGNLVATYTYRNGEWNADQVVLDADYKFNMVGNYTGWYESGLFTTVKRDAKLEITKVDDRTGEYDGVFHFSTPDKPDDSGSYYVKGRINIDSVNGDIWTMTGEKWIKQPSGFYMTNLEGRFDQQDKKIIGDNSFYTDKFELTKVD